MIIDAIVIYAFSRSADNNLTIKAIDIPIYDIYLYDILYVHYRTVPYPMARQSKMTYGLDNVLYGIYRFRTVPYTVLYSALHNLLILRAQ